MTAFNLLCLFSAFAAMEGVAWFAHKYVMHGFLWCLHRDHHSRDYPGFFERNDFFFLLFAAPGIALIYLGATSGEPDPRLWLGAGIAAYGLCYLLVHDLFIHQRFKISKHLGGRYGAAVRRAHRLHHRHLGKEDGECFGMLWVPRSVWGLLRRPAN
jgi:beta-carotene 3-hydroxylase